MRSMRTNGASKNRDSSRYFFFPYLSFLVSELFLVPMVTIRYGIYTYGMYTYHTASLDTIFVQIYMDAPPGVPGVSKNPEKFSTYEIDLCLR